MNQEFFIRRAGKQFGPFSSQRLKDLACSGKLRKDDIVLRHSGDSRGVPARNIKGLFVDKLETSAPIPSQAATVRITATPPPTISHCPKCGAEQRVVTRSGVPTGQTFCSTCKAIPGICPF